MTLQPDVLRRTALILVSVGLVWNVVEGAVALWAGFQAGSVALVAFGLDSARRSLNKFPKVSACASTNFSEQTKRRARRNQP